MHFELWDVDAGNMVGDFDTEVEALQCVRDLLTVNAAEFGEVLSLGRTDVDGTFAIIAEGTALVERARSLPVSSRRSV